MDKHGIQDLVIQPFLERLFLILESTNSLEDKILKYGDHLIMVHRFQMYLLFPLEQLVPLHVQEVVNMFVLYCRQGQPEFIIQRITVLLELGLPVLELLEVLLMQQCLFRVQEHMQLFQELVFIVQLIMDKHGL